MLKPTNAKTIDEYLGQIDEPRKTDITNLHEFIKKLIPDQVPHILAGMIAYGTFHYKSKSGREGDWAVIMLASQKNYISLYICATDGKEYIAEKNKKELPKANIGKSCIRFNKLDDIDLKVVEKLIIEAMALSKKPGFFSI